MVMLSTHSDLNRLIPYGYIATRQWLLGHDITTHQLDNLVKSGRLVALAPGVYRRWDTELKWQGLVSSLQLMGYKTVLGGLSALEQGGFAHYLAVTSAKTVRLYGEALPGWVQHLGLPETFKVHGTKRLFVGDMEADAFTSEVSWGEGLWTARVSTAERAIMEVLDDVPDELSFEHADQLMQGLTMLSPRRLDALLRQVRSVKVKRLFFWLANRHTYPWLGKLTVSDYDLGSGKRVIAAGGRLDRTYQITVPSELHG